MGKFTNKLARFFYGRYGNDTLNKVLTGIYLVWLITFSILNIFIRTLAFTLIGWGLTLILFIWILAFGGVELDVAKTINFADFSDSKEINSVTERRTYTANAKNAKRYCVFQKRKESTL